MHNARKQRKQRRATDHLPNDREAAGQLGLRRVDSDAVRAADGHARGHEGRQWKVGGAGCAVKQVRDGGEGGILDGPRVEVVKPIPLEGPVSGVFKGCDRHKTEKWQ